MCSSRFVEKTLHLLTNIHCLKLGTGQYTEVLCQHSNLSQVLRIKKVSKKALLLTTTHLKRKILEHFLASVRTSMKKFCLTAHLSHISDQDGTLSG